MRTTINRIKRSEEKMRKRLMALSLSEKEVNGICELHKNEMFNLWAHVNIYGNGETQNKNHY